MTEGFEADVAEWNKQAALEEIANLKQIRTVAWEEHSQAYRWLMASLLGINGGACIAILGSEQVGVWSKIYAGGCWTIGILASLLIAVFGQHSVQKSLDPLQKFIGYWMTVHSDGVRADGIENDLLNELKASSKIGFGSRIAGWVAASAFLAGAIFAGQGLADDADCSASALTSNLRSDR